MIGKKIISKEQRIKISATLKKRWSEPEFREKRIQSMRKNTSNKFWSYIEINSKNDCWNWMTGKTDKGYGVFHIDGKGIRAHRLAFLLSGGILTKEKPQVLHHCDNPSCCNPAHLFAGNRIDNMQDMKTKGRATQGEKSGMAKLKETDVFKIRELDGKITRRKIARIFGICHKHVSDIINRKRWAHI